MKQFTNPITFKHGLTIKNRIAIAPMTTRMSYFNGKVTNDEINYYASRTGETGLFITGVAYIQPDGIGWTGELGVHSDDCIPGLSKLAAAIKENGSRAILQIFHAGRMTNSQTLQGLPIVAPSKIPANKLNAEIPKELTIESIEDIIQNFKEATRRAILSGFDGIELHGANHFLLQQFFSPHSNRRTDKYGGSLEKRYQFIREVVDAVLATVDELAPQNFIVGYRISPREETTPGYNLEETLWLVDKLADTDLDYLHLSLTYFHGKTNLPDYQEKSMLQYIYETINGRIPLISVGQIHTRKDLEAALQHSDIAAIGSAVLLDPHWIQKILTHQDDSIRHTMSPIEKDTLQISDGAFEFLAAINPDRIL